MIRILMLIGLWLASIALIAWLASRDNPTW